MLKNIGANWVLTVLQVFSAYLLMPYTIRLLGKDSYGVWILISSITGYLGLLMLGTPMASVRHFAQKITQKNNEELNEAFSTFGVLYLFFGLISALIGVVLVALFPMGMDVSPGLIYEGRLAMAIVLVNIAAGFFQQLPYGLMAAYHDFVIRNVIVAIGILLKIGFTLLVLFFRPSISALALIQLGVLVFEFICSWGVVYWKYPAVRFSLRLFRWSLLKGIFSFSLYVMLLNIGTQLSFQTDSIVIGSLIDISKIPYYTVANSLTVYFMEFLIAVAAVVMPMATKLQAEGALDQLREVFLKWSKICLSLSMLGGVYLIVFGPRFISWWVGADFEEPAGRVLQILMLSYIVFLPIRGVAQPILMGLGKPGLPTVAFLVAGVLNLIMSILLAPSFGLVGVAWGTAIPNIIFALSLMVLACRELKMDFSSFLNYVAVKVVIGSLPVFLLAQFVLTKFDVSSTIGLGLAGIMVCTVFGIISVAFVYKNDPYLDIMGKIRRSKD